MSLKEKCQKEIQMCPGLQVIKYMSTSICATTCSPTFWLNFNIASDREYKILKSQPLNKHYETEKRLRTS